MFIGWCYYQDMEFKHLVAVICFFVSTNLVADESFISFSSIGNYAFGVSTNNGISQSTIRSSVGLDLTYINIERAKGFGEFISLSGNAIIMENIGDYAGSFVGSNQFAFSVNALAGISLYLPFIPTANNTPLSSFFLFTPGIAVDITASHFSDTVNAYELLIGPGIDLRLVFSLNNWIGLNVGAQMHGNMLYIEIASNKIQPVFYDSFFELECSPYMGLSFTL